MSNKDTVQSASAIIATWRWRIVKAGHTVRSFAAMYGFNAGKISQYCSGKIIPRIDTFDQIEASVRELEG